MQIVDEAGRIGVRKTAQEHLPLIDPAIAVRIAQPDNLRSLARNHAVTIKNETRQIAEPLAKNMLLIKATAALRVLQNDKAVAAIRASFLAGERHPHPASGVPIDVNRFSD